MVGQLVVWRFYDRWFVGWQLPARLLSMTMLPMLPLILRLSPSVQLVVLTLHFLVRRHDFDVKVVVILNVGVALVHFHHQIRSNLT